MIQHQVSVRINRSVEDVFAFLTDPTCQTTWQAGLIEITQLTEGSWHKGTRLREVRNVDGRPHEGNLEIIALETNHYFEVRNLTGTQKTARFSVTVDGTGTLVTYQMQMEIGGMLKAMEPVISGVLKQEIERDFARLIKVLEKKKPAA
jgi:carbon monoxide dehydrogenase subunit G